MDDEIDAELFHPSRGGDAIVGGEVVPHHSDPVVTSRIDDAADRRLVRAPHHDDEIRARLRHHLRFQVSAVHRLQVRNDGVIRESRAQPLDGAQPLGEEKRRARLEPVDARFHADRR
ncbi:MAG TPA: hypothetical protein VFF00_00195, partial [Candidatus Elarobacter sp.]|nr:hypothetical protein [Candidatus Elarobacter sp.]